MLAIGDKVELAFNKMPAEERNRLENAVSGRRKSKVDQKNHQTEANTGVVEAVQTTAIGTEYLVRVNLKKSVRGRLRIIPEGRLSKIS